MGHLKRITTNVRALWAIPHVLREISKTLNEHHKRNQSHERRLAKISAGLKETERRVSKLSKTLDTVNQKLTQDRADRHALNKRLMKWRRLIRGQMSAVVRRLYMPDNVFSDLLTIKAGRFQLHSQHEEDGILMALFSRAGATSQRFVEIGCGRSGGNAAMFVKELGLTGTHA